MEIQYSVDTVAIAANATCDAVRIATTRTYKAPARGSGSDTAVNASVIRRRLFIDGHLTVVTFSSLTVLLAFLPVYL